MTNVYIGELPPPYGGVTRKNKLTYENVFIDANTVFLIWWNSNVQKNFV